MRPALTDRQIAHMVFRIALFRRRGVPEQEAERMADRLADRDYELDDRRVCLECRHRQDDRGCFPASQGRIKGADRRLQTIPFLLQRCAHFVWARP